MQNYIDYELEIKKKYRQRLFDIRYKLVLAKKDEEITRLKQELKDLLTEEKKELIAERKKER